MQKGKVYIGCGIGLRILKVKQMKLPPPRTSVFLMGEVCHVNVCVNQHINGPLAVRILICHS